jgi:dTMP kinase
MLIAFEGLDGTGKSTLIARLASELETRGVRTTRTSEPYNHFSARTADEFIADRAVHVRDVIDPWLHSGSTLRVADVILCDRYVMSTAAYQADDDAHARHLLLSQRRFPQPALTIVLTAPIDLLEARMAARGALSGFDAASRAFKEGVQARYRLLAATYPGAHVVDATNSAEVVADRVLSLILEKMRQ